MSETQTFRLSPTDTDTGTDTRSLPSRWGQVKKDGQMPCALDEARRDTYLTCPQKSLCALDEARRGIYLTCPEKSALIDNEHESDDEDDW